VGILQVSNHAGNLPLCPEYHFMRGQKVYNEIIKTTGLNTPVRKGRNNSLVTKRNECLIARYYYYGYYKNKCYEDIIRLLVTEFFLSPVTVAIIIQNNTDILHAIKLRSPVLHYLQSHWPHMRW
jgi:hypothetical protein